MVGLERPLFVEVGFGAHPVPLHGTFDFTEGTEYVGIDSYVPPFEADIDDAISKIRQEQPAITASFIKADARSMPLPDNCVDEMFLGNVLGDSSIDTQTNLARYAIGNILLARDFAAENNMALGDKAPLESHTAIIRMLAEARRILKNDGRLVLLESQTPPNETWMNDALNLVGFYMLSLTYGTYPDWEVRVATYNQSAAPISNLGRPAYLVEAKKVVGEEGLEPSRA